jgi:hypothetical protein
MRIAWWRGIQRLYLVAAALWVCAVVVLGLEDVRRPLHDEPILAMAVKCKAIQDKDFYGLPEEEQMKVYTAICPELETSYSRLSYGARVKVSTGHYQGRTQSDVQVESRQMARQSIINFGGPRAWCATRWLRASFTRKVGLKGVRTAWERERKGPITRL